MEARTAPTSGLDRESAFLQGSGHFFLIGAPPETRRNPHLLHPTRVSDTTFSYDAPTPRFKGASGYNTFDRANRVARLLLSVLGH